MTTSAIWWIRRDLRLHDNPALAAALRFEQVIPLFILDEQLLEKYQKAEPRLAFLFDGLRRLDEDLRKCGSYLVVRSGDPRQVLPQIVSELDIHSVFAQDDTNPYARERDQLLAEEVRLIFTPGTLICPAGSVLKNDQTPYTVFTPFKKTAIAQGLPQEHDLSSAPDHIPTPAGIQTKSLDDLPQQTAAALFPAGEAEARRRLEGFLANGIADYSAKRNFMGTPGTSQLSAYLRFGMVSAREAAVKAIEARGAAVNPEGKKGADTWLSELLWRDFFNHVEFHFPHVQEKNFNPAYDSLQWLNNTEDFQAWCTGHTGYPVVDAAMRQLNETGWMHNRTRMIVASFLVKDLLIDWRWGEKYFMEKLVDGDPASNNGGWQWSAGTGTDAAPYFRIFNPISQSQKFDLHGEYIRRWVPELAPLNDKQIHAPWEVSSLEQQAAGVIIGQDYPEPIIIHKFARQRTLDAYKEARENG